MYKQVQEKIMPNYSFQSSLFGNTSNDSFFFTKVSDLSQEFVKSAFHTAEPNLQVE